MTYDSLIEKLEAARTANTKHLHDISHNAGIDAAIAIVRQHQADVLTGEISEQFLNERMCIAGQWWVRAKDHAEANPSEITVVDDDKIISLIHSAMTGHRYHYQKAKAAYDAIRPYLRQPEPVSGKQPVETAPKGIPVIVAGGLAMQKTGGEWFTGMEEPLYQRPLQWHPKWWMPIPTDNDEVGV